MRFTDVSGKQPLQIQTKNENFHKTIDIENNFHFLKIMLVKFF